MDFDGYYIFASSVAALVARICTHPSTLREHVNVEFAGVWRSPFLLVDTIKTRLQVSSGTDEHIFRRIFHTASPIQIVRSLYRGLPVTLVFSVPALSVYLTCYETTKKYLDSHGIKNDAMLNHLISGCMAEVAAGVLFTPMEVMKNRLQTQSIATQADMSLARQIYKTEGIRGFFRGYWMGLAVFVPHTMTYFATYEQFKMMYANYLGHGKIVGDAAQLPLSAYLLCSGAAGTLGICLSTPLDIVKTRWQISASEQGRAFRQGPIEIARHMWKEEGRCRAFTKGLATRIAWGIPTTAISMTVFEYLKDWRQASHQ